MSLATTTSQGEIKLAGDLAGSNDAHLPRLTDTTVTPGAYINPTLTIDSKGRVTNAVSTAVADVLAVVPDASTTVKGIASVGTGLNVDLGVISVPVATGSVRGTFTVGSGLIMSAGQLSADMSVLPDATTTVKGIASVGAGLNVASGVISLAPATTTTRGGLKIGLGLEVDAGGVVSVDPASLPIATSTTLGLVKSANVDNIVITAGAIDVGPNIAKLDTANVFTKAQVVARVTPSFSSSMTLDFSLGNVFHITPTSNFTLNFPTNVVAGGTYIIVFYNGATWVPTWNVGFKWATQAVKTLSNISGKYDVFTMVAISNTTLLVTSQIGF